MKKLIFLITLFLLTFCGILIAQESIYSKEEICLAIWMIEGGKNTNYPYGIKSVNCNGKEDCKNVCFNTVENNRIRYKNYGHKQYETYLEFLASRYCPITDEDCENWLPNLKFYLTKEEKL